MRATPRFMPYPAPKDCAPEVGMVFVRDYRHDMMECEAVTITEVDGDDVTIVEHLSGRCYGPLSWRRRFQRIRPDGSPVNGLNPTDVEFAR